MLQVPKAGVRSGNNNRINNVEFSKNDCKNNNTWQTYDKTHGEENNDENDNEIMKNLYRYNKTYLWKSWQQNADEDNLIF